MKSGDSIRFYPSATGIGMIFSVIAMVGGYMMTSDPHKAISITGYLVLAFTFLAFVFEFSVILMHLFRIPVTEITPDSIRMLNLRKFKYERILFSEISRFRIKEKYGYKGIEADLRGKDKPLVLMLSNSCTNDITGLCNMLNSRIPASD